jgi:alpha-tubulin suppressor-like RCC1 family protein
MPINTTCLIEVAQNLANCSSFPVDDMLAQSAATKKITSQRTIAVNAIENLPDLKLCAVDPGTIVHVNSLGVPVVSTGRAWAGLDNRIARKDFADSVLYSTGTGNGLGDGTTVAKSSPVSVIGGIVTWKSVSAGSTYDQAVGLTESGLIYSWGINNVGQLGDGTIANKVSPVPIVGGFTDWCQVDAGWRHTLAVRTNGTAWAWGYNSAGRLGDGTTVAKSSPVSVIGGFTNWCQVSGGDGHSAGVRTNGTVWMWGANNFGQLGTGNTTSTSSPVSVLGGFTDWCQVAAGRNHTLGIRTNGTAWSWGNGACGALGTGNITSRTSPVSVIGGFTDWCQVAANRYNSLGLRTNGTLWAWGVGGSGALGDGTTVNKSSPVSVIGGFTDWCQVAAGYQNAAALRANGTAWAWGYNNAGRLGDGTTVAKSSPVQLLGGFTDWKQIGTGNSNTFAIRVPPL